MREKVILITIAISAFLSCTTMAGVRGSGNSLEPDGVLCLIPVMEQSCIAVAVPLNATQAFAGLKWYNNDGELAFPKILLVGGRDAIPPEYSEAVVVAEDVIGEASGWSELQLSEPVAATTEALYVIMQLPQYTERTGLGNGGGPGLGYQMKFGGPCVFLSSDGEDWVRLHESCRLMVEAILVAREPGMATLSAAQEQPATPPAEVWETALLGPRPNPFNPLTSIEFTLKEPAKVELRLYNVRGELVRDLFSGFASAGPHVVQWSGKDETGRAVASGVYFVRMRALGKSMTHRLLLVR